MNNLNSSSIRLIVGLGNPGLKYNKTRHNFGFLFLDFLQKNRKFLPFKEQKKYFAEVSTGEIKDKKVTLLKPLTFMNQSGKSVLAWTNFFKIAPEEILIINDDLDLDFGNFKFRARGGSGGHNGLKDISRLLNTENFPRLKIGINDSSARRYVETSDFVLSRFSPEQLNKIPSIFSGVLEKLENDLF